MTDDDILKELNQKDLEDLNNFCEECKKEDKSVSQNLILTGFKICELMATLAGIHLYKERGYKVYDEIIYESKKGNRVKMFKMTKSLNFKT